MKKFLFTLLIGILYIGCSSAKQHYWPPGTETVKQECIVHTSDFNCDQFIAVTDADFQAYSFVNYPPGEIRPNVIMSIEFKITGPLFSERQDWQSYKQPLKSTSNISLFVCGLIN